MQAAEWAEEQGSKPTEKSPREKSRHARQAEWGPGERQGPRGRAQWQRECKVQEVRGYGRWEMQSTERNLSLMAAGRRRRCTCSSSLPLRLNAKHIDIRTESLGRQTSLLRQLKVSVTGKKDSSTMQRALFPNKV